MKIVVLILVMFGSLVFGQSDFIDKEIGLSGQLQPYELRIYISQDAYLQNSVFVLKKVKDKWEAVYYGLGSEEIKIKKLPVHQARDLWLNIIKTKINRINDDVSYKEINNEIYSPLEDSKTMKIVPESEVITVHSKIFEVYIHDGVKLHKVFFLDPKSKFFDFPDIDEYQYFFKFLWLIENHFNIKLDNDLSEQ